MSKEEKLSQIKKKFDEALLASAQESGDVNSFEDLTKMKDKYLNMKRKTGASKLGALEEKLNKKHGVGEKKKKFLQSSMKLGQKTLRGELTGNKLNISKSKGEAIEEYGESFKDKYTKGNKYTRGKKLKYTDITFYLVIAYVIFSLSIDEDHWFTISHDHSLYIFVGFILSFLTNDELGFPIKFMRTIMIDLMGEDYKYGFSYFFEKIWIPLFGGVREGSYVFAMVFSWPFAKLILYIPILAITFFQYIIPVVITIILIPITLVVALLTGIPTAGAGADIAGEGGFETDAAEAEADMFIASVLKKIWRTINKIIPVKRLIAVYIIGMIFYTILLPRLIYVYMTFLIIIVIHIIFNKLLIEKLLNALMKFVKYNILKVIIYVIIMGLYYYIQIVINYNFMLSDNDPVYTIMIDMLGQSDLAPWKSPIHLYGNTVDLLCPNPVPGNQGDEWPHPHLKKCVYISIFLFSIKLLSHIADTR